MEIKLDVPWRDYARLTSEVYRHYPQYRDSMLPLLKEIACGNSTFSRHVKKTWAGVYESGKLLASAMLISSEQQPNFLSMAFFEALDNSAAALMLLEYAKKTAAERGIDKVIVGINGHMNYGMGLLCDGFDLPASFWSAFNPPYYYTNYQAHADKEHGLTSFLFDLALMDFAKFQALFDRINKRFTYRQANLNQLNSEIALYTQLMNGCFGDHPFYRERTLAENYEMVEALLPFLRGDNLIIAEDAGQPVGYVLWHPDFNELISPGKSIGLTALLKYRLGWPKISRFKIAEIGVLPQYKGSGLIFGLLQNCFNATKTRFPQCESGWVMNDNFLSHSLSRHFGGREYKHYKVLEFCV